MLAGIEADAAELVKGLHDTWNHSNVSFEKRREWYAREIERLRKDDFAHLDGQVYVDHAGATLYSGQQLQLVFEVSWTED